MATSTAGHETHEHAAPRSVWESSFSDEQRRELLHDDTVTWETVIPLLLAVICTGVTMMAFTVYWVYGH